MAGTGAVPTSSEQRLAEPPQRPSRWVTWLLLALTLILAAGPMLIDLGGPEVFDRTEAQSLVTSIHSYRQHEAANGVGQSRIGQLVPYYNGKLSLERAPGTYWVQRLAMETMSMPTAEVDRLVVVARRVSVGMALLTIAAVFWCGFSVGGQRAAVLAALVLASNPIFIYHARLATPAICHTGWAMLSIAAALWAIRPLKPSSSPERQLIGWLICGLALGAATLTAGSVTAITVVVPILLLLLLCENRVGHLMGLLAALFMGVLALLPWVLYAHEQDPEIWQHWLANLSLAGGDSLDSVWLEAGRRALILALAVAPWTIWYIAGAAQPFSTSSKGQRIRLLLGGVWFFAVALALLAMPEGGRFGHLLPALGPAAVLVGQLFNYYAQRASTGRYVRLWRWLRWAHLLLLVAACIAAPVVLFTGAWLSVPDAWRRGPAELNEWILPTTVAVGLLVIVLIGARWAWKHYPAKALVAWAIWALVLMAVATLPLTHDKRAKSRLRQTAQLIVDRLTDATPAYWLGPDAPHPAVLLYAQRTLPRITAAQVKHVIEEQQPFYLIGPEQMSAFADELTAVEALPRIKAQLWRFTPPDE